MYTDLIFRVASQALSAAFGSFAVFCLYYAGHVSNPDAVRFLLEITVILGGLASAIVYGRNK